MTEQQLIDAIHQAKLDYQAAAAIPDQQAMDMAQADSINYKQQLYDLRNPSPPPPTLDEAKAQKKAQIRARTNELIGQGFVHNAVTFSMDMTTQIALIAVYTKKGKHAYPLTVTTLNGNGYTIADAAELETMTDIAFLTAKAHADSGRSLMEQVNAAVDIAGVDAVVDNR